MDIGAFQTINLPDIGAFQFVAAVGGATPKYPLGLPLYGPFRGPLG